MYSTPPLRDSAASPSVVILQTGKRKRGKEEKKVRLADVAFRVSSLLTCSATGGVWSVLTAQRAAVEKVSGHVSFPLDFDEAAALQLVAFAR